MALAASPSKDGLRSSAARVVHSTWFLAAVIALLSWVPREVAVHGDLDPSFIAGLHMAADLRLAFGSEFVATYGPLGFLAFPQVIFDGTAVLSALYAIAVRYALSAAVLWTARRSFPLYLALPLALLVVAITPDEELAALAFLSCCVALAPEAPRAARPLAVYGNALLTGLALLVKVNVGFLVLALSLITVIALPGDRVRQALAFLGTLVAWVAVLLLATGQPLLDFPDYLSSGIAVSEGYQTAQVVGDPPGYVLLLVAAMIGGAIAAVAHAARRSPGVRRASLVAVVAIFCFAEFKIGFVRYGHGVHIARFASAMTLPWLVVSWIDPHWRRIAGAAVVATSIGWFLFTSSTPVDRLDPVANSRAAVNQALDLLVAGRRERLRAESRAESRDYYGLDPRTVALLSDESLHVEPWEASLAWAYDFDWDPAPAFQTYLAATPTLDRLNADHLSAEDGPSRIFRRATFTDGVVTRQPGPVHLTSIDERYAAYDAPAQTLAMLCHFEALETTPTHQVLARVPDRCGPVRELREVEARYGEPIAVPRAPGPEQVVIAEIDGVAPAGAERLRTALFRGLPRYIAFDDGTRYRLTPLNASEGLILRASPQVDFPLPFALAPNAETITLTREPGVGATDRDLRIRFLGMRVAPRREG